MGARQLLEQVWLVGSGTDPVAHTDPHDCHCYLLWDGDGGVLIDAGTGRGAARWLANVREVCPLDALVGVVVTHYHADHAGGAAAAVGAGLTVFAHPVAVAALAAADEEVTQLARARSVGVYPHDYRLEPAAATPLEGGGRLGVGHHRLEVVDAPGHCDGHVVIRVGLGGRTALFSGDCLFAGGAVSMQAIPDCRLDRYAETVIALAATDTDVLLPGHGEFVLQGAQAHVEHAAAAFSRLVPPRNVLPVPGTSPD